MSALDDLTAPRARPQAVEASAEPSCYRAEIKTAPDGDGLVEVLIDGEATREKPCRYSPMLPDAEPAPGDLALVCFDQDGAAYVIGWWAL